MRIENEQDTAVVFAGEFADHQRTGARGSFPVHVARAVYPSVHHLNIWKSSACQGGAGKPHQGPRSDPCAAGLLPRTSARHVHWKASARSGSLMVREFTREDDCRILLVSRSSSVRGKSSSLKPEVSATSARLRARRHHLRQPGLALLRKQFAVAIPERRCGNSSRSRHESFSQF